MAVVGSSLWRSPGTRESRASLPIGFHLAGGPPKNRSLPDGPQRFRTIEDPYIATRNHRKGEAE